MPWTRVKHTLCLKISSADTLLCATTSASAEQRTTCVIKSVNFRFEARSRTPSRWRWRLFLFYDWFTCECLINYRCTFLINYWFCHQIYDTRPKTVRSHATSAMVFFSARREILDRAIRNLWWFACRCVGLKGKGLERRERKKVLFESFILIF